MATTTTMTEDGESKLLRVLQHTIASVAEPVLPTVLKEAVAAPTMTKKKAVVPFLVLAGVQFLYAGHQILSKVALVSGIDPLFFSVFRNAVAFLFLAPPAFFLERDVRPKMTLSTFRSLNLLAFFRILGNQQLFLLGLTLTSPLFTAVVQNTVPVITFLLAALIGVEKVSFRKTSDHARMFGTLMCIGGAVTMTLYKGIAIYTRRSDGSDELHGSLYGIGMLMPALDRLHVNIDHHSVGVLCLLANCTSWALYLINQGPVLQMYPALLSMAAIMQLLGSIQVAIVGVAIEGFRCLDLRLIKMDQLVIILYGGIVASGINLVLQAWCIQRVGPFIVSLFNPVQTLIVAFLAILVLGDTLYTGLLIGGILIIGGFYIVIYGQRMDQHSRRNALDDRKQSDLEEPLLA